MLQKLIEFITGEPTPESRRPNDDSVHFQERRRRNIFKYWDGTSVCRIDPLAAEMAFENHESYRSDLHPQKMAEGDTDAMMLCVQATRDVFDIPEYDGQTGLTTEEVLLLYRQFGEYLNDFQKKTELLQTPPQPTASTSGSSIELTTPHSLDSGSTSPELSGERPTEYESPPTPSPSTISAESRISPNGSRPSQTAPS